MCVLPPQFGRSLADTNSPCHCSVLPLYHTHVDEDGTWPHVPLRSDWGRCVSYSSVVTSLVHDTSVWPGSSVDTLTPVRRVGETRSDDSRLTAVTSLGMERSETSQLDTVQILITSYLQLKDRDQGGVGRNGITLIKFNRSTRPRLY